MSRKKPKRLGPFAFEIGREIEQLVASPEVSDVGKDDIVCRLSEFFLHLAGRGTEASGALAREVYVSTMRAWQFNRREEYDGPGAPTRARTRRASPTSSCIRP